MKLADDVDICGIAAETNLFTGADLAGLCREAGMAALRENIAADTVYGKHFRSVTKLIRPSLTLSQIDWFENFFSNRYKQSFA
jgi:SpoVK/Ycf46/Vps4 family AAA+-type ATPase